MRRPLPSRRYRRIPVNWLSSSPPSKSPMQRPVSNRAPDGREANAAIAASRAQSLSSSPFALAALWVIAVSVFALAVGHRQFGGYDLSPLIDIQYRLAHGERPGSDFIFTFPLTLALLLKL